MVAKTSKELASVFSAIGFKLGNEYLVLYRSFASPQTDVNVKIAVAGFPPLPKISYTSPALAGVTASFHKSTLDRIVQSPLSVILLVVLILLLLAYAVSKLFSLRGRSFRSRMSSFVDFDDDDDTGLRREEIRAALADADSSFQRSRFIRGFADDVALAGIRMSPLALVFLSIVIALLVGMVLAVIGNAPIFLLLAFTGPIFLRMFVTSKVERKRRAFGDQLSDNLDVLAQSLRAGHSLPGALAVVADSAPEPSHEELARVISDERLGVPLEDALGSCVTRMQSRDLEQVALVALLQRDAGGNAAEVIDQVAYNIRTRQELRRLARTLTAQGRMTRWILTALPIAVFLGIYVIDSNYLAPLWETTAGQGRPHRRDHHGHARLLLHQAHRQHQGLNMVLIGIIGLLVFASAVFMLVRALAGTDAPVGTVEQIQSYGYQSDAAKSPESPKRSLAELAASIGTRTRNSRFAMGEEDMRALLVQAGMYSTSPDRLLGYQVLVAAGLGILTLWLTVAAAASPVIIVLFTIGAVIIGWLSVLFVVRRRIRQRHDEIEYELPELIDLLVVSIEAGLSFPSAMRTAADRIRGPLGQELRLTLQEQNMGLSVDEALVNLQKRADTGGIALFTRSIIQGQALGVSMGHIMRTIADEMRKRRKAAAEETAQKAPIKMLFPLVFLIFPAMFIVILLPAIISITNELGGA